jgi:propionyl-CoA carboxylase beta chain
MKCGAVMVDARKKEEEVEELRKKYKLGGGLENIGKAHSRGKLTARERIGKLVDPESFKEFNLWAEPTRTGFGIDRRDSPGDGVVTGFAKIDGRPVCVYAHDFTVLGGTQASVQYWKTCKTIDTAVRLGLPYIGIIDSGGVRIQDAFGYNAGIGVSSNLDVWYSPAVASGIVPSMSLTLGASYAGTAYSPYLADVVFMVKKPYCYMSLASPELIETVTFKEVTRDEIGSPQLHAEVTGSCDYLGETEEEVLQKARELLSFLPSNCREKPPMLATGDDPGRLDNTLIEIIPSCPNDPYDMHEIIKRVVDNGHFLELKQEYAKNLIIGFGRIAGRPVGIVANNPLFLRGALDLGAAEKEARFIRYCDAFNIPLVFFVDTPGFVGSAGEELLGLLRHAAMASYAICEATVPKISFYIGKCHNHGQFLMGTRLMGVDEVLAWPTADIRIAETKESLEACYGKAIERIEPADIGKYSEKHFHSPRHLGALLFFDDIIRPRDTRPTLAHFLEITERKSVVSPKKKHGNIPL